MEWKRVLMMSVLLLGASIVVAQPDQPGPFERFFRSLKRSFNEPQHTSHPRSHTSGQRSKSDSGSPGSTPAASAAENPGTSAPPNERNTRTTTKASSKRGDDFRYGIPVPGKKGFVTSPYSPDTGYIDVRGFQPGTPVKDPYSGKIILTP
jgi:hypothetical protein